MAINNSSVDEHSACKHPEDPCGILQLTMNEQLDVSVFSVVTGSG